ncbi:hypothetical protein Peur_025817 [Populus x canadensis]
MGPNITLTKQRVPNYMFKYLKKKKKNREKEIERQGCLSVVCFFCSVLVSFNSTKIYWYAAGGVSSTPCLSILNVLALLELPFFVFDEIGFGNYYSSCFCAQRHRGPSRWYDLCEDG